MSKSIYSVVLDDGVVDAVDRLAYREGVSRSELMNQILVRALQRAGTAPTTGSIREVLAAISTVMDGQSVLQTMLTDEEATLCLCSALQYKHNPGVQYAVRLYPRAGQSLGELQVQLRTQNPVLLLYLGQFFKLWAKLEDACLAGPRRVYAFGSGQYTRVLRTPQGATAAQTGAAIAAYVRLFDDCLKIFFESIDRAGEAVQAVQHTYKQGLDTAMAQL